MLLQKFFHPIVCATREGRVSEQPKMIMRQLLHIIILTNNFRLLLINVFFFTPFFSFFAGRMSKPHPHCGQNVWRSPPIMRNPRLQAKVSPLRIQGRTNSSTQWGQKKEPKISKMCRLCSQKIRESPFLLTFVIKKRSYLKLHLNFLTASLFKRSEQNREQKIWSVDCFVLFWHCNWFGHELVSVLLLDCYFGFMTVCIMYFCIRLVKFVSCSNF